MICFAWELDLSKRVVFTPYAPVYWWLKPERIFSIPATKSTFTLPKSDKDTIRLSG